MIFVNESGVFALLALWGALAFVFFIIAIVLYILASLGLYKLAQNAGIENPWLAWIPIGNFYILAKLIKTLKIGSYEIPRLEIVLPLAPVVASILGGIPVIGWIFTLASGVLYFFALYKLFTIYRPQNATVWLILSIVLPFMGPIFIFLMRKDRPLSY